VKWNENPLHPKNGHPLPGPWSGTEPLEPKSCNFESEPEDEPLVFEACIPATGTGSTSVYFPRCGTQSGYKIRSVERRSI